MNIQQSLIDSRSKENIILIRDYIGEDTERFDELMQVFLNGEMRLVQRSIWVVTHVVMLHPTIVAPYVDDLLKEMEQPRHSGVLRNTMKMFADVEVPMTEDQYGKAVSFAFDYLENPQEAIAVKAHSMGFLWKACAKEPDLAPEFKMLLEENMSYGSSGVRARAKKIIGWIDKAMG